MQALKAAAIAVSTLVLTGCPSEFGKEGRVAKAVHHDAQEQLGIKRCSEAYKNEVCTGPNQNPDECRQCSE